MPPYVVVYRHDISTTYGGQKSKFGFVAVLRVMNEERHRCSHSGWLQMRNRSCIYAMQLRSTLFENNSITVFLSAFALNEPFFFQALDCSLNGRSWQTKHLHHLRCCNGIIQFHSIQYQHLIICQSVVYSFIYSFT